MCAWQPSEALLAIFRSELGERLARLEAALASADAAAARHEAHAVVGAAGQLGFLDAAAVARSAEERLAADELDVKASIAALTAWLDAGCPVAAQPARDA